LSTLFTDRYAFPRHIPIRRAAAQPNPRTVRAPHIIIITIIISMRCPLK